MRRYEIYGRRKRILTRLADAILSPLARPQSNQAWPPPAGSIGRLLVIRTAYLGDVVMALPALRAFRRGFPDARITILTSEAGRDLVAPEDVADEILCFEPPWFYPARRQGASWREIVQSLRAARFDAAVELRGDLREILGLLWASGSPVRVSYDYAGGGALLTKVVPFRERKHKVDLMLDLARAFGIECRCEMGLERRPAGEASARALLHASGVQGDYLLVHPGTRVPLKRYDRMAEAVAALARDLPEEVAIVAVAEGGVASMADLPRVRTIPAAHSIDTLVELVRGASACLVHDSAPWHIAQAVGTPACALFGPSKPWATGLYPGRPGVALSRDLPCRDLCDEARCRLGAYQKQCLAEIDPERVVEATAKLLRTRAALSHA